MKSREIFSFCLAGVFAGLAIGLGATASLFAGSLLSGLGGRLVGGCLFTLGMFLVIAFELRLFTGMNARIPQMRVKDVWQLPVCFMANAVGIAIAFVLVRFSFFGETVAAQGSALVEAKLDAEGWIWKSFCSAVLCGVLITFSVLAFDAAKKKGLSATFGALAPIAVFAFCGFDHSVANMFYLYCFGECSLRVVGYVLIVIAGNVAGGVLFPLVMRLFCEKKEGDASSL